MESTTVGFGAGQPSRTSIVVAALRAFGAREPDPAVRNPDFLAERLITVADLQHIPEHPIAKALQEEYKKGRENQEVSGMSNLMLVRTRFIDDHLQRAVANGATQVVILGAGFDTRAYRFAETLKDKNVFELDFQSTQEIKKQRLREASMPIPPYLHLAEIDFKLDSLRDVLRRAGYQPEEKTFFIWEGVSMYLTEGAVRETLRNISRYSGPGSSLVMDFAGKSMIDMLRKFPNLSQHNYTTRWGEPWTFGVPDTREQQFFRECGLELRETLSFVKSKQTQPYLTRSDGSSFGSLRGGPPKKRRFGTTLGILSMFLTRRSQWYALAKLDVENHGSPRNGNAQ
jgi:methyltransferase (TIGR00027 family)